MRFFLSNRYFTSVKKIQSQERNNQYGVILILFLFGIYIKKILSTSDLLPMLAIVITLDSNSEHVAHA